MATSLPKQYADLVALLPPRPIRTIAEYRKTVAMVDALAGHRLNRDQDDYLEILSQQIECYEAKHLGPTAGKRSLLSRC